MSIARYKYGIGSVYAFRTDVANATPIKICDIQEASVAIKAKIVKGRGQNLHAVALARSEEDMTGKIKFLRQDPRIASDLYHGVALTSGKTTLADGEAAICAALVTVANAGTYLYDEGVVNALNGASFTRVSANPTTGQYTCDTTGKYVFSAADIAAAVPVLISYGYQVAGSGLTYTVTNQLQGTAPVFQLHLQNVYNSPTGLQIDDMVIYCVQASSYSEGGKIGEFCTPELDWEAQASPTGKIYTRSINGSVV
jgi:hypothetical protein